MTSARTASYFKVDSGSSYWTRADLLASASIYAKMHSPTQKARSNKPRFSPTFCWRITEDGKRDIRNILEKRFAYTRATIYPDVAALGTYLRNNFTEYAPVLET
jgi:hypothetical protein